MDYYEPFTIYSNISKYMLSKGYRCDSQNDLLECVKNDDMSSFFTTLYKNREYFIDLYRAEPTNRRGSIQTPLTSYERMTAKWKKLSKDIDAQILVYYHTPVSDGIGGIKKVAKTDTTTSLRYFVHSRAKCLLFVHGPEMISAAHKQLSDPMSVPSNKNYRFETRRASIFQIKVDKHIYVNKHEKLPNPEGFLKAENLDPSKMAKISFEDPAILNLGAKKGDIIMIHRNMDHNDVSTLFYREVTDTPMEIHKTRKTARTTK
jgi:DNA-directed RNA polymerase subunit H (RpoH/RPB5)